MFYLAIKYAAHSTERTSAVHEVAASSLSVNIKLMEVSVRRGGRASYLDQFAGTYNREGFNRSNLAD